MARLEWDLPGTKTYEFGVDRGVVYPDKGAGAAWIGLTSVDVKTEGGDVQPYYIDGFKYLNVAESTEFAASISAMSTPPEFDVCLGTKNISRGLYATNQWIKRFDFSYRTMVGEGGDDSKGYKLNLVYNALAKVGDRSFSSKTEVADPTTRSIEIATTPVKVAGFKPTSRFVIDSRTSNPFVLGYLESILYGSNSRQPRMPSINEVLSLFGWTAPDVNYPLTFLGEGLNSPKTVTNLFTNPSFEKGSGEVTVYENLFTNPSFRTVSAPVVVHQNRCTQPSPVASGIWAFNGTQTGGGLSYVASVMPGISSVYRLQATTLNGGGRLGFEVTGLEVGKTYTFGLWSWNDKVLTRMSLHDGSTPTWISSGPTWAPDEAGFKTMTWVATQTSVRVYSRTEVPATDITMEVTAGLVVEGEYKGGFFSGTYSPDPGLTPSYLGAPNNSVSVLTGETPSGYTVVSSQGTLYRTPLGARYVITTTSAWAIHVETTPPPTAGEQYTLLTRVKTSWTGFIRSRINTGTETRTPVTAGEWVDIRTTLAPNSSAGVGLVARGGDGWAIGDNFAIQYFLLVKGTYSGPYFDGSTPHPDPDFTTAWKGAAHASTSKVVGSGVHGVSATQCVAVLSTRWSKSGQRSLRLIPTGSTGAHAYISGSAGPRTAVVTAYLPAPLTGVLNTYSRALRLNGGAVPQDQAPNVAGEHQLRVFNPDSTGLIVLGHGGGQGSGDVWYDCLGFFEGDYKGPWFAGDQTVIYKKQQLLSKWTGAPDASISTIEYQEFLPEETNIGDVYIINGYMYVFDSLGYWINLGEVPII